MRVEEASNPGAPSEFDLTVVDSFDDEPIARRIGHEAGAVFGGVARATNESEGVRTRRRLVIVGGQTQVDEPTGVTVRDEESQVDAHDSLSDTDSVVSSATCGTT